MSDIKNWVFLILLVNLILLPAMWVSQPKSTGQVLGAREVAGQEGNTESGFTKWFQDNFSGTKPVARKDLPISPNSDSNDLPPRTPMTQITSETDIKTVLKKEPTKTLDGKIVRRDGFKGNLAARDFSVGDKLTLKCGDKVIVATVDSTVLSLEDTLAVVSSDIFKQLGQESGDVKELQCSLTKV